SVLSASSAVICLMKKIGILFGQEGSFPPAFVDRVNLKTGGETIRAEFVRIDKVIQGEPCGYDVVIDRISQDVPFYRAWLKNAAITGTAVVNNPFWWSADDKFFNNALATKIGVAVPKTVLLPSHQLPTDTNENSFRNLGYPLDWESIFNYVGWPAFFKPFARCRSGQRRPGELRMGGRRRLRHGDPKSARTRSRPR